MERESPASQRISLWSDLAKRFCFDTCNEEANHWSGRSTQGGVLGARVRKDTLSSSRASNAQSFVSFPCFGFQVLTEKAGGTEMFFRRSFEQRRVAPSSKTSTQMKKKINLHLSTFRIQRPAASLIPTHREREQLVTHLAEVRVFAGAEGGQQVHAGEILQGRGWRGGREGFRGGCSR